MNFEQTIAQLRSEIETCRKDGQELRSKMMGSEKLMKEQKEKMTNQMKEMKEKMTNEIKETKEKMTNEIKEMNEKLKIVVQKQEQTQKTTSGGKLI